MFEKEQWQHVENPIHCLVHYSDKMENHPLLFERGQWQHVENDIHCLVKQQWQHMEIHPVLTKFALKAREKLHPLMFERKLWQYVENPIHCLVLNSGNIWNTFHWFLSVLWKHAQNQIHCFLREGSDNMWKTTHTLLSETAVTACAREPIRCLLNVLWEQMENNIHCFLKKRSDNMWKTVYTLCEAAVRTFVEIHPMLIK